MTNKHTYDKYYSNESVVLQDVRLKQLMILKL